MNVVLDGALAALAVPVARVLADPSSDWLHPWWLPAVGAVTLLLAGLPFRLPWQYWRFAGIGDLLSVAGTCALGAVLFAAVAVAAGVGSPNPAFAVVHALTLLVLLGAPRVAYRRLRERPATAQASAVTSALLVGAAEDIDLFLRALAQDRRQALRGAQAGGGFYKIVNLGTGGALGLAAGAAAGATIELSAYTGADGQLWKLEQFPDGGYRIRNKATGLSLSAGSAGTVVGEPFVRDDLHLWTITTP